LLAGTAALLLTATSIPGADAICEHFGKKCDKTSPCCKNGYCDSKPSFCADGCEPENSYSEKSCYPRPGCVNFETTFDDAKKLIQAVDYDANPNNYDFVSEFQPDHASIDNGHLRLDMKYSNKKNEAGNYGGFGATVTWTRFIEYGKVTAVIKSASLSKGVVSSFITRSPEGDEIDFEWVGKNPTQVESNFYFNNELDWTKGGKHEVGGDTSKEFHEYTIEWMPDYITWYVDGKAIRTVRKTDTDRLSNGTYKFPNKLSRVQFSIWDGGSSAEGTAQWAGTPTDWSDKSRVYSMYVKSLKIECLYPNKTGEWPPEGYGPIKDKKKGGKSDSDDDDGAGYYDDDELAAGFMLTTSVMTLAIASVVALFGRYIA
jgi:beta-glucanase (GH16 family)